MKGETNEHNATTPESANNFEFSSKRSLGWER